MININKGFQLSKDKLIGNKLNSLLSNDGTRFKELVKFFEKELDIELDTKISKQLNSKDIDTFLEKEDDYEAFYSSDISKLVKQYKSYFNYYEGVNQCQYCGKLYFQNIFDNFLMNERDIIVCHKCTSKDIVKKEAGFINFEFVTSKTSDIPEDFVENRENSIEKIIELLDILKEIIEYGHSIEFARILTMGGYNADETDYLKKYQDTIEKAYVNNQISKEHFDFFVKLLNASNLEEDMPLNIDHKVFQLIRLSNY